MLRKKQKNIKLPKIRIRGIPVDLKAVNSLCSPKLPSTIVDDKRMARGSAKGIIVTENKPINWSINLNSKPFPTNSSIYFQRNWSRKIKSATKRVRMSGPKNEKNNILSTFFKMHNRLKK